METNSFRDFVRDYRRSLVTSKGFMAETLGLDLLTYSAIEKGELTPPADLGECFITAFGLGKLEAKKCRAVFVDSQSQHSAVESTHAGGVSDGPGI